MKASLVTLFLSSLISCSQGQLTRYFNHESIPVFGIKQKPNLDGLRFVKKVSAVSSNHLSSANMLVMDDLKAELKIQALSSGANSIINVKEFTQKKLKTNSFGREIPYFEFSMTGDAVFDPASSLRILPSRIIKSIPKLTNHEISGQRDGSEFYKTENGDLLIWLPNNKDYLIKRSDVLKIEPNWSN